MAMAEQANIRTYNTKKEFLKNFKKKSRGVELWHRFLKKKPAVIGFVLFIIIVLLAIFAPFIADYKNVANRHAGDIQSRWPDSPEEAKSASESVKQMRKT